MLIRANSSCLEKCSIKVRAGAPVVIESRSGMVSIFEFDLISVGGSDILYVCDSRYAGGVMHVSYHDLKSAPEILTRAGNDICGGHADAALVNAIAAHAGRAVAWLRDEGASFARAGNMGRRQWIPAPLRPAMTQMDWRARRLHRRRLEFTARRHQCRVSDTVESLLFLRHGCHEDPFFR